MIVNKIDFVENISPVFVRLYFSIINSLFKLKIFLICCLNLCV